MKLDISDPSDPTLLGRTFYEVGDSGDGHSMTPLTVSGTRYVIQNDEDYDPRSPVTVTSSETGGRVQRHVRAVDAHTLYDTGDITGDVVDGGDAARPATSPAPRAWSWSSTRWIRSTRA
ncbi:MAG TPA: hypothetical protein VE800_07755 [Actinomycetota bacterium]|nr:hypothetical protein [Actinomycetota bacterium]